MSHLGFRLLVVAAFALVLGACTASGNRTDNRNTNGSNGGPYVNFNGGGYWN